MVGHVLDALIEFAAVGDVFDDRERRHPARPVTGHPRDGQGGPDDRAVLMDVALLHLEAGRTGPLKKACEFSRSMAMSSGWVMSRKVIVLSLLAVAGDALEGGIDPIEGEVVVDHARGRSGWPRTPP